MVKNASCTGGIFMKKIITSGLIAVSLGMTGCAGIISGANQTLTFRSVPEEALIFITNKAGEKFIQEQHR